jgi:predicted transcriptional regulator
VVKRLTVYLPDCVAEQLGILARQQDMTRAAVIRQAIGALSVMREANRRGLHVGATVDREALNTLIAAP